MIPHVPSHVDLHICQAVVCYGLLPSTVIACAIILSPLIGITVTAVFTILFLHSMYCVFFGPLSHFPGPRLAALTKLYELYHLVYKNDWLETIEGLHELHGPVVRIGPNELHMTDHMFCLEHHRRADLVKTSTYYGLLGRLLGGLATPAEHAERKQALQPLFQGKTLAAFSAGKMNDLLRTLRDNCINASTEQDSKVNMTHQIFAFTNDVMLSYLLGQDAGTGFMEAHDLQAASDATRAFSAIDLATSLRALPVFKVFLDAMPALRRWSPLGWLDAIFIDRLTRITNNHAGEKGLHQTPTVLGSAWRRVGDASITTHEASQAVFIGNESLLSNLTFLLHFLTQHPAKMRRLRKELDTLDIATYGEEVWRDPAVMKLPYLDAICRESTRLSHPGWHRQPRQANEGIDCHGKVIPPMTSLSFTPTLLERDPALFENPTSFEPERWLGPDGAKLRSHSVTFGTGTRTCLGQHIARVVLRKTIAALVYTFDIEHWDAKANRADGFRYLNTYPKKGTEGYMTLRLAPRTAGRTEETGKVVGAFEAAGMSLWG